VGGHIIKFPRRQLLHLVVGAAALPGLSRIAFAQTYPTRPVRIIVGFGPGSPADILARLIGQRLAERLAQPFIVENRPGAGGNLATELVVRAPADGHTLVLAALSDAVNVTLYDKLTYNFIRDIAPVASLIRQPEIMVVNPSVPATTIPGFIAYAKANPGKINMGSAGNGTAPHLAGELFKIMAGVDMVHVPYRGGGGAAVTDLLGGQVQILFISPVVSIEHVKAGSLRALGVTTAARPEKHASRDRA
jgi:tripartite-type tricarboxylate transporter receptor subunit TctC